MGITERMDTLIYYKCEHFATVCLHSMVALGVEIFEVLMPSDLILLLDIAQGYSLRCR